MTRSTSTRSASRTPLLRVGLIATLAVLAAATIVAWQPSGQFPTTVVDSSAPATTVASLEMRAT